MHYPTAEDHPVPLNAPQKLPGCPGCTYERVKTGPDSWQYVYRVSQSCRRHRNRIGRQNGGSKWIAKEDQT